MTIDLATWLRTEGSAEGELLCRCYQLFNFFMMLGYPAEDIFLSYDDEDLIGMSLKAQGRFFSVRAGKPCALKRQEFYELWQRFAGALQTAQGPELEEWIEGYGKLRTESLLMGLARDGLRPWQAQEPPVLN